MVENKARLIDATRRLLQSGTSEEDAAKSMTEVGLSHSEAAQIVLQAKEVPNPAQTGEDSSQDLGDFFDSESEKFFSQKPDSEDVDSLKEGKARPFHRINITEFRKISPVLVSEFDKLIDKGGLKRSDITILCGASGTGKTTFGIEFLYNGAKVKGEKGIYITLEESPQRIKENMLENFGWDIDSLESKGLMAVIRIDPMAIARAVEANIASEKGKLYIEKENISLPFLTELPFTPDRLVFDSISAVKIVFGENTQGYREYMLSLFDKIEKLGSINIVTDENPQNPELIANNGTADFLADGIVALYSIKTHNRRESALEILKLRSSSHSKKLVPYKITSKGFEIFSDQDFFYE